MKTNAPHSFLRMASAGGVFLLGFTLLTAYAQAQSKSALGQQESAVQRAASELQLTTDQQVAFVRIIGDFRDSVEATMEKYNFDPEEGRPPLRHSMAIRSDMKSNVDVMEQQLAAVLTSEQMHKFRIIRRQMRAQVGS